MEFCDGKKKNYGNQINKWNENVTNIEQSQIEFFFQSVLMIE